MGVLSENNGRTYQQNLVWQQLTEGLTTVETANSTMERRATKIVAGSAAAVAAITGVHMFPDSLISVDKPESVVLVVLCLTVLMQFRHAARLWGPTPAAIATASDVNKLYDEYISVSEDVAYNNVLIDSAKRLEHAVWVNEQKGDVLRSMLRVLYCQIVVLAVGIVMKAFL